MKDKAAFKEFMAGIGEVFNKEITPVLTKIYWKVLEPFNSDECKKAFSLAITYCKFFPKPADLIEFMNGSLEQRAIIEADKLIAFRRENSEWDYYKELPEIPEMIDPVTRYLMTCRWDYVRWAKDFNLGEDLPFWKREFISSYLAHSKIGNLQVEAPKRKLKLIKGIEK